MTEVHSTWSTIKHQGKDKKRKTPLSSEPRLDEMYANKTIIDSVYRTSFCQFWMNYFSRSRHSPNPGVRRYAREVSIFISAIFLRLRPVDCSSVIRELTDLACVHERSKAHQQKLTVRIGRQHRCSRLEHGSTSRH